MAMPQRNPRLQRAVIGAALAESVVISAGVVAFIATGQWIWLVAAIGVGAMILLFALAQAGAFEPKKR
jgi:hypothetical protein